MRAAVSDSKRQIAAAFAPVLKAAGYRKRRLTWYRDWPDTITVFDVQRSRWSDSYYLNLGVYLKALGDEPAPGEHRCHVRTRVGRLVPEAERLPLLAALDFDTATTDPDGRMPTLVAAVSAVALPWLERYAAVSELRDLVRTLTSYQEVDVGLAIRDHFGGA